MRTFKKLSPALARLIGLGLGCLSGNVRGDTLVDFSDLTLSNATSQTQYAPNGTTVTGYYWNGPDPNGTTQRMARLPETVGQFTSGGVAFPNTYDNYYGSWSGWAYSNVNDTTTDGWNNQYAAAGRRNPWRLRQSAAVRLRARRHLCRRLARPARTASADDHFARAHRGTQRRHHQYDLRLSFHAQWERLLRQSSSASSDWFTLTISGFDANGNLTGTPSISIWPRRRIVNNWTNVNLTSLGNDVKTLQFDLTSSDNGEYGMNTPA